MAAFIACMVRMASVSGRRPSAGITLIEKARRSPAISPVATAAAAVPAVIRSSVIVSSLRRGQPGRELLEPRGRGRVGRTSLTGGDAAVAERPVHLDLQPGGVS